MGSEDKILQERNKLTEMSDSCLFLKMQENVDIESNSKSKQQQVLEFLSNASKNKSAPCYNTASSSKILKKKLSQFQPDLTIKKRTNSFEIDNKILESNL